MKGLVSCAEAGRLDAAVREMAALPDLTLMEDASLRLWDQLRPIADRTDSGKSSTLVALCGSGNNSGDALAVLRHARFAGYRRLAAILGRDDPGELAARQLLSLRALGIPILSWLSREDECRSLIRSAGLLLDGISGTGLRGRLREPLVGLVEAANAAGASIVSVDLPSGLADDYETGNPLIMANWTLSIEPSKAALFFPACRKACGDIVDIKGIFPDDAERKTSAELLSERDLGGLLRRIPSDAYKGSRGRLAVFAGSTGTTGAASLCSRASLSAGAGYTALFADPDILQVLASKMEAVMVRPEPVSPGDLDFDRWDAILAGPGWGRGDRNRAALNRLLGSGKPMVLDAEAIRIYGELRVDGIEPVRPLILTPHPGEFAALCGLPANRVLSNPLSVLPAQAAALGAVIILKSHVTWIAAPDGRLAVWDGMESGLGTAGSGDVLAGLVAGLLASEAANESGPDATWSAACGAVIAHGLAGRRARARLGWFEAGALVEEAGRILGGLS